MDYPYVSIIIPAYNAQDTLQLCLDSITRLDYPVERREVILVNNNSHDATEDIARRYAITIVNENNEQSSYAARNLGIQHAKGDILLFTDTDCIVTPQWINKLLESHSNPEIGCFAGNIKSYQPKTLAECFAAMDEENHNQERSLQTGYLPAANTANVAYRKELFQKIGLFNSGLKSGGDAELTWRLVRSGQYKIIYVPEAIVYHKHRTSIRDLYRQHRKYGESITDLLRLYPGSCGDTFWFAKDIVIFSLAGMKSLPGNLYRYYRGNASVVEVWFDLLKAMCRLGLVVGRVRAQGRRDNESISRLLVVRYVLSKTFIRLKSFIVP
ncbi:MAG: glycosyltransferase [Nitrospirae bacterium]|nr:glycosyltransferase [Nitrospirota bacterium]